MTNWRDEMSDDVTTAVRAYYEGRLETFGATAKGVDWNSTESQELRFSKLLPEGWATSVRSLLDYGCGYGALLSFLRSRDWSGTYEGYDVSADMIAAARELHGPDGRFAIDPPTGSYQCTLASGVFNVRLDFSDDQWEAYIDQVLDEMWSCTASIMAFNMLTSYSDPGRQRKDLYYADPSRFLDRCIRRYSSHARLHHGYGLYEFTIQVEA
jgi:SAM-dependent methyltransferase